MDCGMTLEDIRPVKPIHSLQHRLRHTNNRAFVVVRCRVSASTKAIQSDSKRFTNRANWTQLADGTSCSSPIQRRAEGEVLPKSHGESFCSGVRSLISRWHLVLLPDPA